VLGFGHRAKNPDGDRVEGREGEMGPQKLRCEKAGEKKYGPEQREGG
jgi:hypothetical protein